MKKAAGFSPGQKELYLFMVSKHTLLRAAAAALSLALLAGCARPAVIAPASSETADSQAAAQPAPQVLAIAANAGQFNPYLTPNSLTVQCADLLFEKLVRLSPAMDLEFRLAQSIESSGLTVTILLQSGCTFADGTPLTGEDVAASLTAAKNSALYGARLTNMTEIAAEGNRVTITLAEPDSLFAYLLDLPILKAGEVASPQPTASGRYTYDGADALVPNPRAPFPVEGGPERVQLTDVANYDEIVSGLALGTVNFYQAEASTSSTVASNENYFRTNILMFLGVNARADNPLCSTADGRALLSQILSRRELADQYISATPATGALNSLYDCVQGSQPIGTEADLSQLETVMAQLGYAWNDQTGRYETPEGEPAAVEVLVYTGSADKVYAATQLQKEWSELGIQVTLTTAEDFNVYLEQIQRQQFELYIGELKLYNNMDLMPFWTGNARYGLAPSQTLLDAYALFRADASQAGAFEEVFAAEMPYIPLLWRSSVTVANRSVSGVVSSVSDLFYSLEQFTVKN